MKSDLHLSTAALSWDDFYSLQRFGITPNLDNIKRFCERLGQPQKSYHCLQIGGTNGKGTVSAVLDQILRCSGYRTALYTSPHIQHYTERIKVGGIQIEEQGVFRFLEAHWDFIQEYHCTFFETATAMALDYFRQKSVEIAVIEVGLGGTYDATSVVNPVLSVITQIALDHTDRLGTELKQIAADKAGIMRAGGQAVVSEQLPEVAEVLQNAAMKVGCRCYRTIKLVEFSHLSITPSGISGSAIIKANNQMMRIENFHFPLTGNFQVENLRTALAACGLLANKLTNIQSREISAGLFTVNWPGRLQVLKERPTTILDVGHNPAAVLEVCRAVRKIWQPEKIITLFSAVREKDIRSMITILKRETDVGLIVPLPPPRGMNLGELKSLAEEVGWEPQSFPEVKSALEAAEQMAAENDLILIVGSHYLAEEVLKIQKYS